MKLAVLSGFFPPRAAAEADYCLHLCEKLAAAGWEVDLITTKRSEMAPAKGYRLHPLMKRWSWREAPRLLRTLGAIRPDAVLILYIGWNYEHQSMVTFLPTLFHRRLPGRRIVTLFFNRYGAERASAPWHQLLFYKLMKLATKEPDLVYEWGSLLTRSDRVIALCEDHAMTFRTLHAPCGERTDVVPPPPLLPMPSGGKSTHREWARRELGLEASDEAIVFFGYLYGPKRLPELVEALAKMNRPKAKLIFIGGVIDPLALAGADPVRELKDLGKRLGVENRLLFTGGFPHDSQTPSRLLYAADVFCLPFDRGVQLNNSSFAAVTWHEAPIVTTTGPWTEKAFRDGENVRFCASTDSQSIAGAIDEVLRDPALARRLTLGAAQMARTHFSWENVLSRLQSAVAGTPLSISVGSSR